MTITTAASATQTCTVTTEHTLAALEALGKYRIAFDFNAAADGDVFIIRVKRMVRTSGTVRLLDIDNQIGAVAAGTPIIREWPTDKDGYWHDLTDTDSLVFTLEQSFGTSRDIPWSVIRDDASGANTADIADAVWDEALSGHTTAGTAGKQLQDIATGTPPSAAAVADAVWDEAASGHLTSGTFGQAAAGARADTAQSGPSSTSITLDASASAVDDLYNGMVISITAGTGAGQSRQIVDYVGATKVATIVPALGTNAANDSVFVIKHAAAPIPIDNADALLNRPLNSITGDSTRRVVDALRFLRNRWRIVTGTLQVYKEDDTTVAWSGAATQTAGDPVSEVDPS